MATKDSLRKALLAAIEWKERDYLCSKTTPTSEPLRTSLRNILSRISGTKAGTSIVNTIGTETTRRS